MPLPGAASPCSGHRSVASQLASSYSTSFVCHDGQRVVRRPFPLASTASQLSPDVMMEFFAQRSHQRRDVPPDMPPLLFPAPSFLYTTAFMTRLFTRSSIYIFLSGEGHAAVAYFQESEGT